MFKCKKCNQTRYIGYEDIIYKCSDCNHFLRICCDCIAEQHKTNNLEILKNKFSHLFRHIVDFKNTINKIFHKTKLPINLKSTIHNYLHFRYMDKLKNQYFNKLNFDIQYISPYGLQIKQDDNSDEYYSKPVFYCISCLKKYNYYSMDNILIK